MKQEEHVRNGPKVGDEHGEAVVVGEANVVGREDEGEEEVERVDKEGDDGGDQEHMVPVVNNVAVGV